MKKIFILALSFQLSGCAAYNTEFECGVGKGMGCKSISEVNDIINNGELSVAKIEKLPKESSLHFKQNNNFQVKNVTRMPERTMRVWINGFTDAKGDYVGETYVYTVIEPGKWQEGAHE